MNHTSTTTRTLSFLFLAAWCSFCPAQGDLSGSQSSVTVQVGSRTITLPPPTLTGDLDTAQQQAYIAPLLRGITPRQFSRDSVVAPVRINLNYIKDESGQRLGHNVHVIFIVHEPLASFSADDLSARLLGDKQEPADSASSETLRSLGINEVPAGVRYQTFQFDLLEKIRLTGLVRVTQESYVNQNLIEVSLVDEYKNRWQAIDGRDAGGAYAGFRGWVAATALQGMEAVLIEARFVMHEPSDWFRGDNFLRSKLPIVIQEGARELRRKLKQKRSSE